MAQVVNNYCDNPVCGKVMRTSRRVRVRQEWDSRCHFGREYCSTQCAMENMADFAFESQQRSRSC